MGNLLRSFVNVGKIFSSSLCRDAAFRAVQLKVAIPNGCVYIKKKGCIKRRE
jgi:hypothetical protein